LLKILQTLRTLRLCGEVSVFFLGAKSGIDLQKPTIEFEELPARPICWMAVLTQMHDFDKRWRGSFQADFSTQLDGQETRFLLKKAA
jgi:hypothetical protein